MNKSSIKFISIFVITLTFLYGFSASYTSDSIDNISYVIALAVDLSEDNEHLQVTFQFMDTSSFSSDKSSQESEVIIDSINASSINSAINLLNAYIGKAVNLSHCKVVVFSDKLAKKGLSSEITELMNNIQVRPTANIIICKGNAMEYIKKSTSKLEKILTKYYDIFPNSSEYTGYTSNIAIGEFYNFLTTKESGNLAILGSINPTISSGDSPQSSNKSSNDSSTDTSDNSSNSNNKGSSNVPLSEMISGKSSILGERGTENIGLAVLKDGVYIGDLTAADTLCHTLISGEVNSFLLSINDTSVYKNYIDISLFENTSPKITVDISDDKPTIKINIKLIGRIDGIKEGINYSDDETDLNLDEISNCANEYLKKYILDYLNKTKSVFKCDIDYFFNSAKHNFLTIKEWKDYDWASKYENSNFEVTVDSRVYYSLLDSE